MPNGMAVARQLDDPPVIPTKASQADAAILERIGSVTADAAVAIAMGMATFADVGRVTSGVKELGGRAVAKLAMLRLEHFGEFDFDSVARAQGLLVLNQRHRATLRAHLGPAEVDAAFPELLDHALLISTKVADDERARTH
jgi:hypothetical protein